MVPHCDLIHSLIVVVLVLWLFHPVQFIFATIQRWHRTLKMMGDAKQILDLELGRSGQPASANKKRRNRSSAAEGAFKRPEGMHRELYALLCSDNKDNPPIIPSDVMPVVGGVGGGYKQMKAKLGLKKVRPWVWMPFVNPGRKDGFKLFHWRRKVDEGKDYPFSKFSKSVELVEYSDAEYQAHLQSDDWTKAETDHLMDLCQLFDLRFIIIQDRWNRDRFKTPRSVEDLKERYYNICNKITKLRTPLGQELKLKMFDAAHERKRKDQLVKLYDRTPEEMEEEQELLDELRKIEQRKKEREKKTQDLQKLITAADSSTQAARKAPETPGPGRPPRTGPGRKKISSVQRISGSNESSISPGIVGNVLESGIKFPEIKTAGSSLRSQRMKLPASVGQKKSKAIEQCLLELNLELRPMPTEDICSNFNELRSDLVLMYELKQALANCEFELQTLKHQREALLGSSAGTVFSGAPAVAPKPEMEPSVKSVPSLVPLRVTSSTEPVSTAVTSPVLSGPKTADPGTVVSSVGSTPGPKPSTLLTDQAIVAEVPAAADATGSLMLTPNRKRRAAEQQKDFLRKVKRI